MSALRDAEAVLGRVESGAMTTTREHVTPERASKILERNIANRHLDENHVRFFVGVLRRGEWKETHQGIALDTDGNLRDGQHRLTAIVRSGIAATMLITYGVPRDAFDVMDVGKRRNFADVLSISSPAEKNVSILAGATTWKFRHLNDAIKTKSSRPSHSQLEEVLTQHSGLRDHLDVSRQFSPKSLLSPSMAAWLRYEFGRLDSQEAETFFVKVGTGYDIKPATTLDSLRRRLLANVESRAKLPDWYIAAIVIKAWNAHLTGRTVQILKMLDDEAFPEIGTERSLDGETSPA